MPVSEKLCWEALRHSESNKVSMSWFKGKEQDGVIEPAVPLFYLEKELVLRYSKNQIEDGLYFLEKRGYFIKRGFDGLTRVVYQLSDEGKDLLKKGKFLKEEQQAFSEKLLDISKPGTFGIKFNLGELLRRFKKPGKGQ